MGIIAGILGKLVATKLGAVGLGAALTLALSQLVPLLKPLIGKLIKSELDQILEPNLTDPVEKQKFHDLAIAAMAYAEYKLPDPGQGAAKKALVVETLSHFLPSVAADAVGDLVQASFESLDEELKKRIQK